MERLVGQNYFDHRRKDEDRMVKELGLDASETVAVEDEDLGIDFKDFNFQGGAHGVHQFREGPVRYFEVLTLNLHGQHVTQFRPFG
ncbi:hypothetical protein SO802_013502 [Lithocarpus litseifolius]|uniref:Uncharacterized protein n=1 Tax=Lithocarpus litseifolius TaxID=425828 RepID=A0AAW2D9W1_9ROSI